MLTEPVLFCWGGQFLADANLQHPQLVSRRTKTDGQHLKTAETMNLSGHTACTCLPAGTAVWNGNLLHMDGHRERAVML